MCRLQVAGYGTWNVPTTFQSECHWADAAPLGCLITDRVSYQASQGKGERQEKAYPSKPDAQAKDVRHPTLRLRVRLQLPV